jgi:hypothetical protein
MKMVLANFRFDERIDTHNRIVKNSPNLSEEQVNQILDSHGWNDYTFKFYDNRTVTVIDNKTEEIVPSYSITGFAFDYMVRKSSKVYNNKTLQYS